MKLQFSLALAMLSLMALYPAAQAANPEHIRQLLRTHTCRNCDLSGANLSTLSLAGANLKRANLSNALLNQTDLSRANLSNANLTGADLTGVNLQGANLKRANLAGVTSLDACPSGQASSSSDCLLFTLFLLVGPQLCEPDADFDVGNSFWCSPENSSRSLAGFFSSVGRANLQGADLTEANLSGAELSGTDLRYATLHRANLKDATFLRALLIETDFTAAEEANLSGAFQSIADVKTAFRTTTLEEEGRFSIGQLNRFQNIHYLDNQRFADTFADLASPFKAQTKAYDYRIMRSADPTQWVIHTAQAKLEGLKSFTGVIFFTKTGETERLICVTEDPSMTPPIWPQISGAPEIFLECPPGSAPS